MGYGLWRRKTDVDSLHNWKYPSMFSEAVRWRDLVLCIIHGPNRLGNHSVSCFLFHVSCFMFLVSCFWTPQAHLQVSWNGNRHPDMFWRTCSDGLPRLLRLPRLPSLPRLSLRKVPNDQLSLNRHGKPKPQFPASRDVIWTVVMALPPLKRFRT